MRLLGPAYKLINSSNRPDGIGPGSSRLDESDSHRGHFDWPGVGFGNMLRRLPAMARIRGSIRKDLFLCWMLQVRLVICDTLLRPFPTLLLLRLRSLSLRAGQADLPLAVWALAPVLTRLTATVASAKTANK